MLLAILSLVFSLQSCGKGNLFDRLMGGIGMEKVEDKEELNDESIAEPEDESQKESVTEESNEPVSDSREPAMSPIVNLTGKIGGKYAVNMEVNLNAETGQYYYVKSGASNPLDLTVTEWNPSSGKLSMVEYNDAGERTGEFDGYLTDSEYSGRMVNFRGQTFSFTLYRK